MAKVTELMADEMKRIKERAAETDYMGFREVLSYLPGVTERYLRYMVATGQVPHYKPTPRKIIFKRSDLDAWLERRKVEVE